MILIAISISFPYKLLDTFFRHSDIKIKTVCVLDLYTHLSFYAFRKIV